MVRRQPPANSNKSTPHKPPHASAVDAELLPKEAEKSAKPDELELKDEWAIAPVDAEVTVVAKSQPASSTPAEPELETAAVPALEVNLMALKESLEQSNQKEQLLQKSVEDLRSQLAEQKTLVQKLQTDLEKANRIQLELDKTQKEALKLAESNQALIDESKAFKQEQHTLKADLATQAKSAHKIQSELDKTQKEALKLAESNQALIDENKALKQAQQTLKAELETKAKSAQLTVQPALAKPAVESRDDSFRRQQAATLAHPVFPNGPMSNGFSDQDIGWFD